MKRLATASCLAIVTLAYPTGGCREAPGGGPKTTKSSTASDGVSMTIGKETFTLEVADSLDEHQRGLMARDSMPADHGMIFVFADEGERSFWMKDTLIPLDIIYLDAAGRIVSIKAMKPRDLSSVGSDGPAKYAIELNRGAAERAGVQPGDMLTVPKEILSRKGSD